MKFIASTFVLLAVSVGVVSFAGCSASSTGSAPSVSSGDGSGAAPSSGSGSK